MKDRQRRPGRGMPFRKSTDAAKSGAWKATLRAFVVLMAVVSILVSAMVYSIVSRGLSAHSEPSRVEKVLARAMRRWATPQAMRDRTNPVQPTPEVINHALSHYADHCASCHANDGSGDTQVGRVTFGAGYTFLDATFQSPETLNGGSNSSNDAGPGLEGSIAIEPGARMPLIPRHVFKAYGELRIRSNVFLDLGLVSASSSYARGNENNAHQPDGTYYLDRKSVV